ncbi:hypothetical protein HWD99_04405 [Microbacterium sp. C5A9]|uniref:hypothetical protein n=1 Tax=Microbacterium sp. C5A9 TaxID=2736663 RepID=UPI001F521D32|nr:hypothetical protein [Microbacterium sp. C5A9]MCI1017861.1 hypothetical protein [Microbacterium sp. C5A9]
MAKVGGEQLTRDELREGVASLSRRLHRHLSAWEAGDQDAMFDVAAVTRTLLANGRGDKAVQRLCSQEKLDAPRVKVKYPAPTQRDVAFAFGGFPVDESALFPRSDWIGTLDPGYGGEESSFPDPIGWDSDVSFSLFEWLQTRFFTISLTDQPYRQVTWEKLVIQYGNAYGSHLGGEHPDEISQTRLFSGHGRTLSEHGLWLAAAVASNSLAELLPKIGEKGPPKRSYDHPVASIRGLSVHNVAGMVYQKFAVSFGPSLGKVELLKSPLMGKTLEVSAERAVSSNGRVDSRAFGSFI